MMRIQYSRWVSRCVYYSRLSVWYLLGNVIRLLPGYSRGDLSIKIGYVSQWILISDRKRPYFFRFILRFHVLSCILSSSALMLLQMSVEVVPADGLVTYHTLYCFHWFLYSSRKRTVTIRIGICGWFRLVLIRVSYWIRLVNLHWMSWIVNWLSSDIVWYRLPHGLDNVIGR